MKKCKECIYRYKDTGEEYCLCDNNKEVKNNKERKIKKIEKIKESIREKSKGREEVYKVMIEVYNKIIEEIREE